MGNESKIEVKVSVTNLDIFNDVLGILKYSYDKLPEAERKEVSKRLEQLVGKAYDVKRLLSKE